MSPWLSYSSFAFFCTLHNFFYLCCYIKTEKPQSLSPCCWKHHHSMMLLPPCFTDEMVLGEWGPVPGFLQTQGLKLWTNSWVVVSQDHRMMFLFIVKTGFQALQPQSPERWRHAFLVVLVKVTIRFFVSSTSKTLLPRLLNVARWPALGKVLVIPKLIQFEKYGEYWALWNVLCSRNIFVRFW